MTINYDSEFQKIKHDLCTVEGYSACEEVIIRNLKKHIELGYDELSIVNFLKELSQHLELLTESNENSSEFMNYKFAIRFISILLTVSYRKDWFNTIMK